MKNLPVGLRVIEDGTVQAARSQECTICLGLCINCFGSLMSHSMDYASSKCSASLAGIFSTNQFQLNGCQK